MDIIRSLSDQSQENGCVERQHRAFGSLRLADIGGHDLVEIGDAFVQVHEIHEHSPEEIGDAGFEILHGYGDQRIFRAVADAEGVTLEAVGAAVTSTTLVPEPIS